MHSVVPGVDPLPRGGSELGRGNADEGGCLCHAENVARDRDEEKAKDERKR